MIRHIGIIFVLWCFFSGHLLAFVKYFHADNMITGKNVLDYSPINIVDNNLTTCWAYNTEDKKSRIVLRFTNFILIDEIRVYNGYQKSSNVYRANARTKEVRLFLEREKREDFTPFANYGTSTNVWFWEGVLKDTFSAQVFKFKPVVANEFYFVVLSTYPGTTYDDTCISEIEFWYRGQKYEVANLEEAKREFVRKVRENARWGVGEPYDTETYIKESGPEVERRLAAYGITNVEVLDQTGKMETVGRLASVVRVRWWVPEEGKGYRMVLYAQKKGSGFKKRKVVRRSEEGDDEYELREVVKIGEAKVDENGTTWAKLGNSEWRAVVIRSGYGRMLMSDYFETFGIGDVVGEGHVAPFPEDE
ncbi:hypothetical protein BREVNS_0690 [Brevinematales bacterium NS]|nr:hypothetical protein BREVNS_0690 [Brevinematales bacterium NS]